MMHVLELILTMQNLVFLIPLGLALAWAVASPLLGMLGGGEGDLEGDADGFDFDGDVDLEFDADADGEGAGIGHALGSMVGFIGLGPVPTILWFQILFIGWGFTGLVAALWGGPLLAKMGCAAFMTVVGTGAVSHLLIRYMPQKRETDIVPWRKRVGLSGRVTTGRVTPTFGEGVFETSSGLFHMQIRTQTEALPNKAHVVVVEVDVAKGIAIVVPDPGEELH